MAHFTVNSPNLLCRGCGYDLAGTPVGSACPECSLPVATAIQALRGKPATANSAIGSLVVAIASVFPCCGLVLAPVAFIFGVRGYNRARADDRSGTAALAAVIIAGLSFLLHFWALVYFLQSQ